MEERLFLWVYLISAVYAFVVLYRRRASPGKRYLAVLLLVGIGGGAGLLWPDVQTPAVWAASALFVFFLVLPGAFMRLARRSAARGRFDRARRYSRVAVAILPVPGLASEAALYRSIDEGGGGFHPAAASIQARLAGHRVKTSRVGIGLAVAVLVVHAVVTVFGDSRSVFTLVTFGANNRFLVLDGEYARLVSAQFLHIGWLHLVLNGGALWLLGGWVEPRFGMARTFLVFLIAGTVGNLIGVLFYLEDGVISAGASGGAMGLLGAAISLHLGKDRADRPPRSFSSLLLAVGATLAIGLLEPGIDNGAHIGGLVTGFLLGLLFLRGPRIPAAVTGALAAAGLLAVLASGAYVAVRAPGWSGTVPTDARGFVVDRPVFLLPPREEEGAWWFGGRPEAMGRLIVELIDDLGDPETLALCQARRRAPEAGRVTGEVPLLDGEEFRSAASAIAIGESGDVAEIHVMADPFGSSRGAVLTFFFPPPGYDEILRRRLVGPVVESFRFR